MKKIAMLGLFAVIFIAGVLLLQHHAQIVNESDQVFRERLPGVWLRAEDYQPQRAESARSMRCTNTVAADGSFVELSSFSHTDRTNTYRRTGTWTVKDGRLIETIKTSTNQVEKTPHTLAGRIVSADAEGFTVRWPNSEETIWRRIAH